MSIYDQLIQELKRERKIINDRIEVLERWTGRKVIHKRKWTLNDKQRKELSNRMKQVWAEKRKGIK